MNFLKIKEGVCINTDKVEALESVDQLHTRIYMTNGGVYEAMFSYDTLIELLEQQGREEVLSEQADNKQLKGLFKNLNAVAKTAGFFAG